MNELYFLFAFLVISGLSCTTSLMLDFALGLPSSNENLTHSILWRWTIFLAKKRLLKSNPALYEKYMVFMNGIQNVPLLNMPIDQDITELRNTKKVRENRYYPMLLKDAREYFTWENMLGICAVCTNFWVSVIYCIFFALIFTDYHTICVYLPQFIILFISIITFSNFSLRKNLK